MVEIIHHRVAIAGQVLDLATQQPISGAGVKIPDLQSPGHLLFTYTQEDGSFYFLDLPNGSYTLQISVPDLAGIYGVVEVTGVKVDTQELTDVGLKHLTVIKPILDFKKVELTATQLSGTVIDQTTNHAITGAMVQLLGSGLSTRTDKNGGYQFLHLQASIPTLQGSAIGYQPTAQKVTLTAGQKTVANFSLTKLATPA
ncbi:carboxypeptidase regulatory-like domain-containing protein [Pantanalinema rosaneae CENA516]|uniref:carboxypeptidase regulatory-like domain-containing protein n=1 Tax=Pantanalinema rosaneae TaxID=1620701 RepID=UPI003D6F050C